MLIKNILGNIKNYDTTNKIIDKVKISPDDRLKKIIRLTSDNGVEIGVNLKQGHIHDGDILAQNDTTLFVIECLPQDVILIKCKDLMKMAYVAHSIGNRHTPAAFLDDGMVIEYDYLIAKWLDENEVEYERTFKVLPHALKHASHTH